MSLWFGEPWPSPDYRAPVCEDDQAQVDTPVGQPCTLCRQAIVEGDRGLLRPTMRLVGDGASATVEPVHIECDLRNVMGNHIHVAGDCRYIGDCAARSTLTFREEALKVWEMTAGLAGTKPRIVTPVIDTFEIKDRGTAYVTVEPDPLYEINERVVMGGELYRITGIERFAVKPKPGRSISLLLKRVAQ